MITNWKVYGSRLLVSVLMLTAIGCANLQQERSVMEDIFIGEPSNFHGYKMYSFAFNDRNCRVVVPRNPAKGYPWIWRAHFFGHRPEVDLALLSRGFFLAYIDVGDLYGNKEAVNLWNDFYKYLVSEYRFSKQVVLEGMSVGGLIVFNWATENARKVSCIYADAPVLDFRSWPGGLLQGLGSTEDWQQCLKAYNMTAAQASSFQDQAINHLEPLWEQKVPVLIVSGDQDDIVPYKENGEILASRLKEHGGKVKVILKKEKGHSHGLEDPQPLIRFVLKYAK